MVGVELRGAVELDAEFNSEVEAVVGHCTAPSDTNVRPNIVYFQTALDVTVLIDRKCIIADFHACVLDIFQVGAVSFYLKELIAAEIQTSGNIE